MKKFKLNILTIFAVIFSLSLMTTSCGDDDDNVDPTDDGPGGVVEVVNKTGAITANETWTADKIYVLNQKVVVENGVTLTINPGTIIKGSTGQGSLASALIIARGGKLMAEGTADQPIIFTSTADNIEVGQTAGTNLDQNDRGLWGGLIVLGNAKGSFRGDVTEVQIEGIPPSDTFGLYGGNNDNDNSGKLKYISIRHGGALIGEGNEINGLTLGCVGSGTEISHIEVVANVDDGVEWFGGSVDTSNVFVWACGDDAIDVDQAYSGTIDNVFVVLGDTSDHGLEIDGPEGSFDAGFTLQNVTMVGNLNTSNGEYADFRSGAHVTTSNVYAYGFKSSSDVELDNNGVSQRFLDGDIQFSNWEIVGAGNEIFAEKVGCAQNCDDADETNDIPQNLIILNPSFTERAANWTTTVQEGSQTGGANTSEFSWTYSNQKAGLGL